MKIASRIASAWLAVVAISAMLGSSIVAVCLLWSLGGWWGLAYFALLLSIAVSGFVAAREDT